MTKDKQAESEKVIAQVKPSNRLDDRVDQAKDDRNQEQADQGLQRRAGIGVTPISIAGHKRNRDKQLRDDQRRSVGPSFLHMSISQRQSTGSAVSVAAIPRPAQPDGISCCVKKTVDGTAVRRVAAGTHVL